MARSWVYSTTEESHQAITDMFEDFFNPYDLKWGEGDGIYERRIDGSSQIALVGAAFDTTPRPAESLQLRFLGCRDIAVESGWVPLLIRPT